MIDPLPVAVGARLSLRFTADDGPREAVGELLSYDDQTLVLLPEGAGPMPIARSAVQAARAVPPRVVRPSSPIEDLEVLMTQGWPGAEQERLGGWLLRSGSGSGSGSRRANSVLPTGESGLPVAEAMDRVVRWYAARGLRPCVQLPQEGGPRLPSFRHRPDALLAELAARGWRSEALTRVMVGDVRRMGVRSTPAPLSFTWSDQPDAPWWDLDGTSGGRREEMLAAPGRYLLVMEDGAPLAAGRLSVVRDWCGLTNLTVAPKQRGSGHGRRALESMLAEAARLGAKFAYLQVLEDNATARGLYDSHGFLSHHLYGYWAPGA